MDSSSGPPPPPLQPRADSYHSLGPPLVTTVAEDESASSAPYTEDDFYCPICQEVFKTPVRVSACQHIFCRKCFLTAMKESRIHCPLCHGKVTRRERACPERALDLGTLLRRFPGNCRSCSHCIELYRMRQHYKTCNKYQSEFGDSSTVPSSQLSPDSAGNSSSNGETYTSGTEARHPPQAYQEQGNASPPDQPTFACPLCEEVNTTRQRLLEHCNSNHRAHVVAVICPICLSLTWGDPTQLTRNFVSHLNQRHQFDYADFVNLQLDEETQCQIAIEESFYINF